MGVLEETEGRLIRPDLENGLLGWAMSTSKVEELIKVVETLEPEDFSSSVNITIFAGVADIAKKGDRPDLVSLSNLLRDAGTSVTSTDLVDRISFTDILGFRKAEQAAKIIKDFSLKRQAVKLFEGQVRRAMEQVNADELLAESQSKILMLADGLKDDRPTNITDIMVEAEEQIKEFERLGRLGYQTGFDRIDNALGGLIPSHVWLLGAYTGTGKTFWTIQVILNILGQGGKVALFSTEMDRTSTYLRILGNVAGIPSLKLMRGNLSPVESERKKKAEIILKKYENQLAIYDNVYTVDAIRMKCKRQQLGIGLDVFFVDFVQNLRGSDSIYERMSTAAVELQQLCKEVNATGILLSQVSNESGKTANADVIQYKGAGELAAIADVGLWLNKSDTPNKLQLLIRKSRHGVSGVESYLDIDYHLGGRMEQGMTPAKDMAADL